MRARARQADAEAFRAAGIGDFDVFDFEREGKRPDGSTVKVAFSLAFAQDKAAPDTGFFTCQQHYPENFWNPAFQQHANGVSGVAGVVFVAENPSDHHIFLKAFAGVSDLKATSAGIAIETPRGEIQVMDPAAYRLHFARRAARYVARHAARRDSLRDARYEPRTRESRRRRKRADGQADCRLRPPRTERLWCSSGSAVRRGVIFSNSLSEIGGFSEITFKLRRHPFAMLDAVGTCCVRRKWTAPGWPLHKRPGAVLNGEAHGRTGHPPIARPAELARVDRQRGG